MMSLADQILYISMFLNINLKLPKSEQGSHKQEPIKLFLTKQ